MSGRHVRSLHAAGTSSPSPASPPIFHPACPACPPSSGEILSAPGGTAKVIQLMYRGILDGQASAGRFLELLAGSQDEAVQAALCHGKVVRMLCKTLGAAPTARARGAALSALQVSALGAGGVLQGCRAAMRCAQMFGTSTQRFLLLRLSGRVAHFVAQLAASCCA